MTPTRRPTRQALWRAVPFLLVLGAARPLQAQAAAQSVALLVTTADAALLAQEALNQMPYSFGVTLRRIQLFPPQARIQVTLAGSCEITLDGTPVLAGGRIAITQPKEYRDGWSCAAVPELNPQPWDLAARLQRASCDLKLPGPRLPGRRCLPAGAIQLTSIRVAADGMHAVVRVVGGD